jgi:predicted MFS family arabinose efflux permease
VLLLLARFACGLATFQVAHMLALTLSEGFDHHVGVTSLSVFGGASVICTLLFGRLADRYGRAQMLGLSYLLRGVGTIALAFTIPNEWFFYALVAVAIGPTYGTIAVNNVMFFEAVGPRLAGVMLGLSFVVHQIASASGPLAGSILFDATGSYDIFNIAVGIILLASAAMSWSIRDNAAPGLRTVAATSASRA